MATYEQVIAALRKADEEGNEEDAKNLAAIADRMRTEREAKGDATAIDRGQSLAGGINRGLINMAGAPVDIANLALSGVGLGSERPVGGSRQLLDLAESTSLGRTMLNPGATDLAGRLLNRAGEEIGATVLPSALITRTATRATMAAKGFWGAFLNPIRNAPLRANVGEAVAAAGAGLGAGIAQEAAPGSLAAETAGQIAGGLAPTALAGTPTSLVARGAARIARSVSPSARRAAGEAEISRMMGKELTPEMAEGVRQAEELEKAIPGFEPSIGEATGSQALIRQQESLEGRASGELLEGLVQRRQLSEGAVSDFFVRQSPGGEGTPEFIIDTASKELESLRGDVSRLGAGIEAERKGVAGKAAALSGGEKVAAGTRLRERLSGIRDAERTRLNKRAEELGLNEVDLTAPFADFRESLVAEAAPSSVFADASNQPPILKALMDAENVKNVTFQDIKALRERIGDELIDASAGAKPSRKQVRTLTIMRERLDDWVNSLDSEFGEVAEGWRDFRKDYFENFISRFETGVAFQVRRKDGKNFYVTPDEKVAGTFFEPGNITAARQYRFAFGDDPAALADIEASALDSLHDATVRDGVIDAGLLQTWKRKHRTVLQEFPTVAQAVDTLGSANTSVIARQDQLAARSRSVEDRAMVRALNAYASFSKTAPEIVFSDAVLRDPRMMSDMLSFLKKTPKALEAFRRQVWTRIGSQDAPEVMRTLEANRPALSQLFSRQHFRDMRTVALSRSMLKRTRTPKGAAFEPRPLAELERAIGRPLPQLASRGFALQTGRVMKEYLILDAILVSARNRAKMTSDELLASALYDPQVAHDLAQGVVTGIKPERAKRLQSRIFALGLPHLEDRQPQEDQGAQE